MAGVRARKICAHPQKTKEKKTLCASVVKPFAAVL
jgi:hypothetical protein